MNLTYGIKCPGCEKKLSLGNRGIECGIHTILNTGCDCGFHGILIIMTKGYSLEYTITKDK